MDALKGADFMQDEEQTLVVHNWKNQSYGIGVPYSPLGRNCSCFVAFCVYHVSLFRLRPCIAAFFFPVGES